MNVDKIWVFHEGEGPLVAAAVHDGHAMRSELGQHVALSESGRLREEDPYTAAWTDVVGVRIIGTRSRFEVDLNRAREKAVYLKPEDAWSLQVWHSELPEDVVERSRAEYDLFYENLTTLFDGLVARYGRFVVYDLHTYNHRRDGADQPVADPAA